MSADKPMNLASFLCVLGVLALLAPTVAAQEVEDPLPKASRQLTLVQALELVETNSPNIKMVEERLKQASLLRGRAIALLIPNASISAVVTILDDEVVLEMAPVMVVDENGVPQLMAVPPAIITPQIQWRTTGTLSSVFDARIFSLLENAKNSESSAKLSRQQVLHQLRYGVLISVHQLITLKKLMEIGKHSVMARSTLLEAAEGRLSSEVGTRFEVTRAKVELSKAHKDLKALALSYLKAREALALLLVTEPDFSIEAVPQLSEPASLDGLVSRAMTDNPALKVARKTIDIRITSLDTTYWSYAPNLKAQFQVTQQPETLFSPAFQWNVQMVASWNLYDGGTRSAQVNEDQSNIRLAMLDLKDQERQITSQIRQAWQDVLTRKDQIETAKLEVELAGEALQQAQDGYKLGAVTQFEVLNSEIQLRISRTQLAREELAYQISLVDLYRLSGQDIAP